MTIALTDTAYPTRLSDIAPCFWDVRHAVLACGDNLDAPEFIISGGLFWGNLCREVLPAIAYARAHALSSNFHNWSTSNEVHPA